MPKQEIPKESGTPEPKETRDETNIIRVSDLHKHFGAVRALDGISFRVRKGEWLSVMGASGSGKTTLLHLLSCMDRPTSGRLVIGGRDINAMTPHELNIYRRETIGLVFQQFHLFSYLNAEENVMVAQYYHSMADREEARGILEKVGLGHRFKHRPAQLSGGEKQRLCIARALVNYPQIILADEPTGNLDKENKQNIIALFRRLNAEGHTILMVTHDPSLGTCGTRQIRLDFGKIIADEYVHAPGSPDSVDSAAEREAESESESES